MVKASIGKRVVAYIIDSVLVGVIVGVIIGGAMVLSIVLASMSDSLGAMSMILSFGAMGISMILAFGYFLVRDGMGSGRSVGKKLMGLKVMKGGSPCSYVDSVKRNITFIVPILGMIELIMPFVDAEGLRFGDKIANTKVVDA
ncbi:MAG: RDD family protein [Candidatus Altiarchaeota archaeon]